MKKWAFLGLLFVIFGVQAQEDSLQFKFTELSKLPVDLNDYWTVDAIGNQYVAHLGSIEKFDSTGTLTFTQSIKSFGNISSLAFINTMKLVHFSEEQQTLCFLDNTLSVSEDCIELANLEFSMATLVCASNQSDRIWVLDRLNSTLRQIAITGNGAGQEVDNLGGILDMQDFSKMIESGNKLYLFDKNKGVYTFDMYGSLIDFIPVTNAITFDVVNSTVYILMNNEIILSGPTFKENIRIPLPLSAVFDFKVQREGIYLRTPETVHKFDLQIVD